MVLIQLLKIGFNWREVRVRNSHFTQTEYGEIWKLETQIYTLEELFELGYWKVGIGNHSILVFADFKTKTIGEDISLHFNNKN